MWYMKYRYENVTIKSLSMQQIVDCDKASLLSLSPPLSSIVYVE
jgi:hypothetical protein